MPYQQPKCMICHQGNPQGVGKKLPASCWVIPGFVHKYVCLDNTAYGHFLAYGYAADCACAAIPGDVFCSFRGKHAPGSLTPLSFLGSQRNIYCSTRWILRA
eukprot:787497-Amphidinium_carterae.1